MEPNDAVQIMRDEALLFLIEAEECKSCTKTSEEWREMCIQLMVMLAETKYNSADIIEFVAQQKKIIVHESSSSNIDTSKKNLRQFLQKPPYDNDFFYSQKFEDE